MEVIQIFNFRFKKLFYKIKIFNYLIISGQNAHRNNQGYRYNNQNPNVVNTNYQNPNYNSNVKDDPNSNNANNNN